MGSPTPVAIPAPDRVPAGRGRLGIPVPTSARGLVRHELTWLIAITQPVWIAATPGLRPGGTGALPVLAGLAMAAWLALLVAQFGTSTRWRWRARAANVAVLAACALLAGALADSVEQWSAAASLVVLAGASAAALVPPRLSGVLLVALALLSVSPTLRYSPPIGPWGVPSPFVPAYVLLVAGCLIGVRIVLERNALRIDTDVDRRDEVERQRRTIEGVEEALRRQERLLHETVLNTLTAIDRGGLGTTPGMATALDQRCREAIAVLADLESGAQALDPPATVSARGFVSLGDDLVGFIEGLRADGLPVEVVVDSLEDVPARVRGAVSTAIREALTNTARHAGAQQAWVLVRVRESDGISVRAEVRDDGRGFDPAVVPPRFGLARAIGGPMEEVGGRSIVESTPGRGTRVVLEWSARSGDAIDRYRAGGSSFALPALAVFGLYLAATAALTWLQFGHPPVTLADLALVVVLGILISLATPEAPLPWGLVVTISALGPLFALLVLNATTPAPFGGGWALAAIAALFMAASALAPPWGWLLLLASWLVVEGDPWGTLTEPATLVVVGGAMLGRGLRRDTHAMERAHERRVSAETGLEVTRESLALLRSRYGPLEDSDAIDLLRGIVVGDLDPEDPQVRQRAGLEETFIRNLVRINPQVDDLRALAARLSRVAHRVGVHLRADLALPPVPSIVVPALVAESFEVAVSSTITDHPARLTARAAGDAVVVTLLTPIADGERDRMRALPVPGSITDPDDPTDPTMLWEARLTAEDAP